MISYLSAGKWSPLLAPSSEYSPLGLSQRETARRDRPATLGTPSRRSPEATLRTALKTDPFGGLFFTATPGQIAAMVGKAAAMREAPLSRQATTLRWALALLHRAAGSFASAHRAFTLSGRVKGDGVAVKALQIEYPEELLAAMDEEALQALAREALMVKLYDLGKVSSGLAAQTLGLSRRQFLEVLSRYGVSPFDDTVEVEAEARRG
jgi:predicted HTH domain antitoxin